jgi:hypothetical protein
MSVTTHRRMYLACAVHFSLMRRRLRPALPLIRESVAVQGLSRTAGLNSAIAFARARMPPSSEDRRGAVPSPTHIDA